MITDIVDERPAKQEDEVYYVRRGSPSEAASGYEAESDAESDFTIVSEESIDSRLERSGTATTMMSSASAASEVTVDAEGKPAPRKRSIRAAISGTCAAHVCAVYVSCCCVQGAVRPPTFAS